MVVKITDIKDARTGNMLNQSWEVSIEGSIGSKLSLFFILNWSQKIDKG